MGAADGFEEFVAIIDSGSLTSAADALGIPRPTLSRRLARLEERLGVRLIHRTTRRLKMTLHGESLYAKAQLVVRTAREAEAELRRLDGVPRGLLRVGIPVEMPHALFAEWVIAFLRAYPEVTLDVRGASTSFDLVSEGLDVALSPGVAEGSSLIVKTLFWNTLSAVASPAYLALHGTPTVAGELASHACIVGHRGPGVPERTWPLFDGSAVSVSGPLVIDQMGMRAQAAKQGLGIALVIDNSVSDALADGELVRVLPEVVGRRERLALVYPDRTYLDPKVRAFVDFIAARIEEVRGRR